MDSLERYQLSKEELMRIDKMSSAAEFSINVSKLDSITKERLLLAIRTVISQRLKDIDHVTIGVKSDYLDM